MASTSEHEQATVPGFCDNCVKGHVFSGTPTGTEKKIGPYDTVYVARPTQVKQPTVAIVFFTDVFGLKLVNNKLVADRLAERTGITVYVPDLFSGDALAADALPIAETAEAVRNRGFLNKLKTGGIIAVHVPWFIKNRPAVHIPTVKELINHLKTSEYGHSKFGAIGYCYGGKYVTDLNASGITACSVLAHPSLVGKSDIAGLVSPTSFALAEVDDNFNDKMQAYVRATLAERKVDNELRVHEGTAHGFASRGNMEIETIKKGYQAALTQAAEWFEKYLLEQAS